MKTLLIAAALAALSATSYAADAAAGKAVYDKSCKTCHGADGTANPAIAKMMKVEIKNLKGTTLSDADIKTIITTGKGKMKPAAGVTGASLDNVVAYVRSLK